MANRRFTSTKLPCDSGDSHLGIERANLNHLFFGQDRRGYALPALIAQSFVGIRRILLSGAGIKMKGISARWIVACMQYAKAVPFARAQEIRKPVRSQRTGIISSANRKSSVPARSPASRPFPTFSVGSLAGGFINVVPKSADFIGAQFGKVYINVRHDLISIFRKIVSRPVASVSALARVAVYYNTEKAVQS